MKDTEAKFSIKGVLGTKSLKKKESAYSVYMEKSITKDHAITSFFSHFNKHINSTSNFQNNYSVTIVGNLTHFHSFFCDFNIDIVNVLSMLKDCVCYIFVSLFLKSKREHL